MARIQPVLTPTELVLVDQVAALTGSKRTEVIKNALAVYHWFVRQALTGNPVVARKPTGEEGALETAELAVLEGKGNRLGPGELGLLAKRLAAASNPVEAARLEARLTRGFDGSEGRGAESPLSRRSASYVSASARSRSEPEGSRISVRTACQVARQ